MIAVGIDVGTSSLELVAIDLGSAQIVHREGAANTRIAVDGRHGFLQDPDEIADTIIRFVANCPVDIDSIAVTGQVHGILYTDGSGRACSPLYTWLDQRGVTEVNGERPADRLLRKSGKTLPAGYGLLTHYAHGLAGTVPADATRITGIIEYVTERLVGHTVDRADSSCLSAFGGWDPVSRRHDPRLWAEVFSESMMRFPLEAEPFGCAGTTASGIPVAVGVGDNQAGFFGLVDDPARMCLISLGTSGQITVFSEHATDVPDMELRPYLSLGYLHVGATLCAGKAYETVQRFFRSILERGGAYVEDDLVYTMMMDAALDSLDDQSLQMTTCFNGKRSDPNLRGVLTGIDLDNLTPGNFVLASVNGIVQELFDFTDFLGERFDRIETIIAAGNAARKNPLFADALRRRFVRPVEVPGIENAAAFGVALVGAISAGLISRNDRAELVARHRRSQLPD
jgi:sedoheptulokinase